jgi:thioredoxin 1
MGGRIREATLGNIRELLQEGKPLVVDFWANWCGPCHVMQPILRTMAEKFEERITFAKVDVQSNRDLAQQFAVKSIPTLILFKNGKEWDRLSGIRNRSELNKLFEKLSSR